jgi:hypothetical protein
VIAAALDPKNGGHGEISRREGLLIPWCVRTVRVQISLSTPFKQPRIAAAVAMCASISFGQEHFKPSWINVFLCVKS